MSLLHRLPDVRWLVRPGWNTGHHDDNRDRDRGGRSSCCPSPAPLAHWPRPDSPFTPPDHRLPALHASPWATAPARLPASRRPRQHGDRRSGGPSQSSRWWAAGVATWGGAAALFCGHHRPWPSVFGVAAKVTMLETRRKKQNNITSIIFIADAFDLHMLSFILEQHRTILQILFRLEATSTYYFTWQQILKCMYSREKPLCSILFKM